MGRGGKNGSNGGSEQCGWRVGVPQRRVYYIKAVGISRSVCSLCDGEGKKKRKKDSCSH